MNKQIPQFQSVNISEFSSGIIIQIEDTPVVFQRPITKESVFQNVTMMTFQQLIMKRARAALRAKSLKAFINPVSIEITITSLSSPQSMLLERILKAIFDGLNKQVIQDDFLVSHAQIWLKNCNQRYQKSIVEVEVRDTITGDKIYFRVNSPSIEKKNPFVYKIGGAINYNQQFTKQLTMIEQSILAQNFTSKRQYEICHMLFCVSDLSKDVDNMFLTYIDFIRSNGYLDISNNIGFGMYKRVVEKGKEKVIINLVAK
ncbi:hypothetical protein ACIQ4I_15730 [Rummeliibacillus sp. NPDC094406]|uniref:hypothetical protein n=1 Tax=Rummeliibacillus sp. NPDC094406 TaxID=3364511 RepID=UPI00382BC16F